MMATDWKAEDIFVRGLDLARNIAVRLTLRDPRFKIQNDKAGSIKARNEVPKEHPVLRLTIYIWRIFHEIHGS